MTVKESVTSDALVVDSPTARDDCSATRILLQDQARTVVFQDLDGGKAVGNRFSTREKMAAALNIPNIGANVAKVIFAHTDFAGLRKMNAEELSAIPGIGPERAQALVRELAAQSEYLDELLGAVKLIHAAPEPEERPTVCFTGKMPEKRSYYEKLAEAHGYAAADDVNSHLSLLVAADVNDTSSKLKKAPKLGIRIVSLDGFLRELEGAAAPEPEEPPEGQLELGL